MADARLAGIRITHPDRVVYEGSGATKLDVARHYADWSDRILPFLRGRPVSMIRCPGGVGAPCFFQRHRSDGMDPAIGVVQVQGKDEIEDYMTLGSVRGLVGAVQMGVIEFHIWGARNDDLDHPDRLVFDLDPDEGLPFSEVKVAARTIRDLLGTLGLPSIPMLSGGKGIHVVTPLRRKADWTAVKALSAAVAQSLADEQPDRFTATMTKARREGRIFIDWLRNEKAATAIAPYALRARPGAGVAAPLTWGALEGVASAQAFDIRSVAVLRTTPCPLAALQDRAVVVGSRVLAKARRTLPGFDLP